MTDLGVNLGFLVPAALCWIGSLYCLGWLRDRPWNPAIAAIVVSFVSRGVAFLIGAPVVYRGIDGFAGVANVSRLLINVCGVVWSVSILIALAYWNRPAPAARRTAGRWSAAAVAVVLVTVILWLRAEMPETAMNFSARHGHDLSVAAYMLMYHGSLTIGLAAVATCCCRYALLTDVTRLRYGMWLTAAGALVYLSFCAHRIAGIVGRPMNWDAGSWPLASPVATGIGAILMMVGLTMPMWGTSIATTRDRKLARRRYRQMTPLWDDLCSLTPAIALPIADDSSLGIEFRLYRRMIEIRDGLLVISMHLPADLEPDASSNRTTDPQQAAAGIHAAIIAFHSEDSPAATVGPHVAGSGRDAEADWLAAVSVAYGRLADAERSGSPLLAEA